MLKIKKRQTISLFHPYPKQKKNITIPICYTPFHSYYESLLERKKKRYTIIFLFKKLYNMEICNQINFQRIIGKKKSSLKKKYDIYSHSTVNNYFLTNLLILIIIILNVIRTIICDLIIIFFFIFNAQPLYLILKKKKKTKLYINSIKLILQYI